MDRPGQKAIVIGEKGAKLKTIGMDARKDMEKCSNKRSCLPYGLRSKAVGLMMNVL